MPFVQQKNSTLANKRRERVVDRVERIVRKRAKDLYKDHFAQMGLAGAMAFKEAVARFSKSMSRRFGLSGTYHTPNGERERVRRRRQIASGQLTESNGLFRS